MKKRSEFRLWFGRELKRARKAHCHSQQDLSDIIYVRRPTISEWETGKYIPTLYQYYQLQVLYGRAYFAPGFLE